MNNLYPTATPLLDAALATLTRLGWLLSPSIWTGFNAVHPGQQRRLDALTVADLIALADAETAKTKLAATPEGERES